MASPEYRAWTKAIRTDENKPGYSASWIAARRGWLNVFSDRLECGDIAIPFETIQEAVLYEARQGFIPVYILAVSTADGTWHFGLNRWTRMAAHLPFPFRQERINLRYSTFSIAVRVALVAYVAYLIYCRFKGA